MEDFNNEENFELPETQAEPRPERLTKARERRRKRQESGADTGTPIELNAATPRPVKRRDLRVTPLSTTPRPKIDLSGVKPWVYVVGAVVLMIAVILIVGSLGAGGDAVVAQPNAIWLGFEWTFEERSDGDVEALTRRLRDHQIGTVYAWTSYMKADGAWSGLRASTNTFEEMRPNVQRFVQQFNTAYPEAELLAWVSLPVDADADGYRLDDPTVQLDYADFCRMMVTDLGFDGVFLNVEPVWNQNAEDFINLLRRVRLAVGDTAQIAVALPPDWSPLDAEIPVSELITPGTEWEKPFKQRVAVLSDQMVVMSYNSGLTSPSDYSTWFAYQLQTYAEALAEQNIGAQVVMGIPTYPNELPAHDILVENVPSALGGYDLGMAQVERGGIDPSFVKGTALYMETYTDDTEWAEFRQWLRQRNEEN